DEGSEIEGKYTCAGTVMLDAKFSGEITSKDTLVIGEHAVVRATVRTATLVVRGEVVGDVTASEQVVLEASARVTGAVEAPFSVLVVHGDGSRVLRVCLPRWIVYGTLGSFAALGVASLSGGYVLRLGQGDQVAALRRRVDEQRTLIDSFHTRVAAVRSEITAWRALHAKMWDALGPEAGAGAGGATPEAVAPAAGVEPPPREELDLLATSVAQEGPRLRELTRAIGRTGKIVHALPLRWPVHGPVKSGYGMRRSPWNGAPEHHDGIDIGSPPGTPVEPPAPGTVVEAGPP